MQSFRTPCAAVALLALILAACGSEPSSGAGPDLVDTGDDVTDAEPADGSGPRDIVDDGHTDTTDAAADNDTTIDLDSGDDADAGVIFCESDADCPLGLCLAIDPGADEGVCAEQCIDDNSCPDGASCRLYVNAGGDAVSVCVPDDLCVDRDGDRFGFGNGCLGPDCDDTSNLINLGADELCDGFDNDCDELVDEDPVDASNTCLTGLAGQCAEGLTSCADGILSCLPITGQSDELCDGIDNNCDGVVDDGNPGGGPDCGTGLPGPCAVGVRVCEAGAFACAQTDFATEEVCDGTDNDCDGSTDESFVGAGEACETGVPGACAAGRRRCEGGAPVCEQRVFASTESCDGVDNDCDGLLDEGNPGGGLVCATGLAGACANGVTECTDGGVICRPSTSPSPEICDLVDNDCDGEIDNDNPGGGAGCATGLPGICSAGVTLCGEAGLSCEQQVAAGTEVCDDLDNDCDGQTDEGNPGGGGACNTGLLGVCSAGTLVCSAGSFDCAQAVAPSPETCDGLDNDCDGQVDEGNPGGGGACNSGLPGVCSAGVVACSDGALVCNQLVLPGAELCDGLDNNCNGVADDGNPGGGLGCATGQQGVCAGGTTACSGGGIVCNANLSPSTETCDGLDNNCNGVADDGNPGGGAACNTGRSGVCAPGTTACSGGALVCNQSVGATSEVCDNLDNDCDARTDEGCPTAVGLAAAASSPQFGGTGGTAFSEPCAAGSVIVGFQGRSGSEIDALGPICAPLSLVESRATTPWTYTITTGTSVTLRLFGGGGGTYFAQQCPAGQMVIGINGRAASRTDRLQWTCGSLSVPGAPGSYAISRSSLSTSSAYGGTGGDAFGFTCPDNQVATRLFGRYGSRLDAVGIQCSLPSLTVR